MTQRGRWGTTDKFATFLSTFSCVSSVLVELAKSIPVHPLMLSSHPFFQFSFHNRNCIVVSAEEAYIESLCHSGSVVEAPLEAISGIVTSVARSYWKRTRSVAEAQKSQMFANAGAFAEERHDRHAHSRSAIQWNGDITTLFLGRLQSG